MQPSHYDFLLLIEIARIVPLLETYASSVTINGIQIWFDAAADTQWRHEPFV